MKAYLFLLLATCFAASLVSCSSPGEKVASTFKGTYSGSAAHTGGETKICTITVPQEGNPVTGTFVILTGSVREEGTLEGSVLGTILTLTLKSSNGGKSYTLDGETSDNNSSITGTLSYFDGTTFRKYTGTFKR